MKLVQIATALVLAAPIAVFAQSDMKGMDMSGKKDGISKGMDMKGMDQKSMSKGGKEQTVHTAAGDVKKVDRKEGTVTLAHGPVKSMKWSAMTMTFKVKDKSMLDKLSEGKKAEIEFVEQGKDYVVTNVK